VEFLHAGKDRIVKPTFAAAARAAANASSSRTKFLRGSSRLKPKMNGASPIP
jgi:hypothetical protein